VAEGGSLGFLGLGGGRDRRGVQLQQLAKTRLDVFANRLPDPVLQQVEDFGDGTISVNDCFKPVSRYFDRIARPEQLIPALNRAMVVLTDPSDCGPATLAMCQDTQAEAYDYPESFFDEKIWTTRRVRPDENELAEAVRVLKAAKKPVIIAGGGVLFSEASGTLANFAGAHGIPVESVVRDVLLASQPNKRFSTVEEIGALAAFLCGPGAGTITGTALSVDGGWTAH